MLLLRKRKNELILMLSWVGEEIEARGCLGPMWPSGKMVWVTDHRRLPGTVPASTPSTYTLESRKYFFILG